MLIYDELDMKSDPQPEPGPALGVPAVLHGRLLHVSRMATIGEMAAGVAHELNQPLTAIANYAQACSRLLARPGADPAVLQQALTEITTQAARAADIIRRLRALASRQQSERAPADVNALVREMIDLVESDARLHGVNVSLELADGLPPVLVDAGQIQHDHSQFRTQQPGGAGVAIRRRRPPGDPHLETLCGRCGGGGHRQRPRSDFRGDFASFRPVLFHQGERYRHGAGDQQHHRTHSRRLGGLSPQPAFRGVFLHSPAGSSVICRKG